jgi:hypothetical protein
LLRSTKPESRECDGKFRFEAAPEEFRHESRVGSFETRPSEPSLDDAGEATGTINESVLGVSDVCLLYGFFRTDGVLFRN